VSDSKCQAERRGRFVGEAVSGPARAPVRVDGGPASVPAASGTGMIGRFVGEALTPVSGTADPRRMAAGGPGLPISFTWRGGTVRVASVLREWRETGACTHGSGERYARKHWFEIRDADGRTMKLYFERRPRGRGARWHLFSTTETAKGAGRGASPSS